MIFYINSVNFATATTAYTDSLLTIVAPDGYYSDGSSYRRQLYGELVDIFACPSIDTVSITNIGTGTATFNGSLISNGGDVNAVRGFVYGTSINPTIANNVVTDSVTGQGTYSLGATGLDDGSTYYVRAYSTIFGQVIYGDELNFETEIDCPDCVSGLPVLIGTQEWTNCNLDVTTYRNSTPIPQVTDPTAWANLTTGAWCYHNNDPANNSTYGKLYNWYAINDIANGGLAPVGYHVPTVAEWTTLTTFLGGGIVAGGKMKETGLCHWNTPNTGATNESSFTGLAGGNRANSGAFFPIGDFGYWWSSTEEDTTLAHAIVMSYNASYAADLFYNKKIGFSVRLIKDDIT